MQDEVACMLHHAVLLVEHAALDIIAVGHGILGAEAATGSCRIAAYGDGTCSNHI